MKAITPPKLDPPFQSTAAKGTFPIEQTNETIATIGPTIGPQSFAQTGCCVRKKRFHQLIGTHALSAPAIRSPRVMSFQTASQSMTQYWLVAVRPLAENIRCPSVPSLTDMSIAAWPSILP